MTTQSEAKISVLVNLAKANQAYVNNLHNTLQKSKLDFELFCLQANHLDTSSLASFKETGKLICMEDNTSLSAQIQAALTNVKGANAMVLFDVEEQIGNLMQLLIANKKHLQGIHVLNNINGKSQASNSILNNFTRLLSPLNLDDNYGNCIMGKSKELEVLFNNELNYCNSFNQVAYAMAVHQLPSTPIAYQSTAKSSGSFLQLIGNLFSNRWHYFVSSSFVEFKDKGLQFGKSNSGIYRLLFFVMVVAGLCLMPYFSQDFGSTWDEKAHNDYAELSYRFLTTGGKDTAAVAEPLNAGEFIRQAYRYYGEQINTISAFAYHTFGTGVYETRHFINSLYGFLGILFVALVAFEIASWRAACLAFLMLFFNPGWFGHSMNNPTDIPFALGFAFAALYFVKLFKQTDKPKTAHLVWLSLGIGIGIASRVGAFLLLAYFALFIGLVWLYRVIKKRPNAGKFFVQGIKWFLIVAVLSYIVGIAIWPFAHEHPLTNPFVAFKKASENAFYTNNVELFEGKRMYMLTSAPWYYVIKFLGIGNPLYLLLGFLGGILLLPFLIRKQSTQFWFLLMFFFMTLFPIAYAEFSNLNYYNAWRHYLFVLPSAVVIAAFTFDYLFNSKKIFAIGSAVIFTLLFTKPLIWFVQNHPNQYVYFNELVGGLKGAYGTYETDYYSNSCREAAEWIAKQHPTGPLKVSINNEVTTAAYWANQINPNIEFTWTRESEEQKANWDYLIVTSRTFSQHELLNGSFPPKGTVYTVSADGIPLAAVVKRENDLMPKGYAAIDRNQSDSAVYCFNQAIAYQPKDEESWRMLGFAHLMLGHLDSAEINLKKAIEIYPENYSAFSSLGLVYFNRKEFQKAIDTFKKATDYKENVAESWYYSGMSYMNLGDYNAAVKQLEMAAKHGRSIPEISFALAQAYEMVGSLQKSSDAYQVALSINPNYKDAWYNLAGVFTKMSRPQYAEECMKRYRALGGQ